ncbi:MAG: ABC transporter [Clostridiales bacterium 43-6]|nr:MAG: ABC transporter [Clostridiales bacterium 43-6]
MTLLTCDKLSVSYNRITALKNVSFHVDDGDYLCIVGENGSGKSTLIKAILQLIGTESGTITLNGIRQTEIGYLPQQTVVQKDFPASVFEVVLSGCLNRKGRNPFYGKAEKALALEKLAELGIATLKNKSYRDLSGGQQQRVLLARALCATRKLIVLDEPVTGLDPLVTTELYATIKELNGKQGIAVIMVSHDIQGVLESANKILHVNVEPVFFGSPSDYLNTSVGQRMTGGTTHA